jgi:hypothetical protein
MYVDWHRISESSFFKPVTGNRWASVQVKSPEQPIATPHPLILMLANKSKKTSDDSF